MVSFYLIVCLIGVVLLVIFAILGGFGGDFEADVGDADFDIDMDIDADVDMDVDMDTDVDAGMDTSLSPLSLPILLVFFTAFGAFGMVLEVFSLDAMFIPFISIAGGVFVAGIMYFVMAKIFVSTQSTSVVPMRKLVGMKAKVSIPIKKGKEGQIVVVRPEKGRILLGAISDSNITRDSVVIIKEVVGDVARVEKTKATGKSKKKQAVMK
jgi:hypothetical protein